MLPRLFRMTDSPRTRWDNTWHRPLRNPQATTLCPIPARTTPAMATGAMGLETTLNQWLNNPLPRYSTVLIRASTPAIPEPIDPERLWRAGSRLHAVHY